LIKRGADQAAHDEGWLDFHDDFVRRASAPALSRDRLFGGAGPPASH